MNAHTQVLSHPRTVGQHRYPNLPDLVKIALSCRATMLNIGVPVAQSTRYADPASLAWSPRPHWETPSRGAEWPPRCLRNERWLSGKLDLHRRRRPPSSERFPRKFGQTMAALEANHRHHFPSGSMPRSCFTCIDGRCGLRQQRHSQVTCFALSDYVWRSGSLKADRSIRLVAIAVSD